MRRLWRGGRPRPRWHDLRQRSLPPTGTHRGAADVPVRAPAEDRGQTMNFRLARGIIVAALALTAGCATEHSRLARRNTEVVRRYFDEWANHPNATTADELIASDLVLINPPSTLHSLAEYKASMAGFHAAFPDLHFTLEDLIAGGDNVVVRWTLRGTHLGEFHGRPATGRAINVTGTSTFRIESDRIREIWVNMDRYGLMEQLGWLR